MNEEVIIETYCGEISRSTNGGPKVIKGCLATIPAHESFAKYNGHNVRVRIEIIADLGLDVPISLIAPVTPEKKDLIKTYNELKQHDTRK